MKSADVLGGGFEIQLFLLLRDLILVVLLGVVILPLGRTWTLLYCWAWVLTCTLFYVTPFAKGLALR